jgi:predicted RNase H-like nuclease (RuvC/YqgF family)
VPEETLERLQRVEERLEKALVDVRGDMAALRGTLDSWDRTVDRMAEYQRSHAMLQEEVRRLKRSQGNPRIDEDPTEAAAPPTPCAADARSTWRTTPP